MAPFLDDVRDLLRVKQAGALCLGCDEGFSVPHETATADSSAVNCSNFRREVETAPVPQAAGALAAAK